MSDIPASKTPQQKLDEMMEKVRSMPPGGDLASLLTREIADLAAAAEQEALAQRRKAEDDRRQADFPPSAESSQ